jgi:hypothetical protein
MWTTRFFGLGVAGAGVGFLLLIWSQLSFEAGPMTPLTLPEKAGMSGVLLLIGLGIFAVVFGLDLVFRPRSAVRRWTPRLPPRP